MSKPIKCPICNVNMDILSNLVSGEDDLYSAKVECPSCLSRFTPVLASTETRARRLAALKCRAWIAKLKTCHKSGECALQTHEMYTAFPKPPRAPGSGWKAPQGVYTYAAPMGDSGYTPIYGCGMSDPVTYSSDIPTVTHATTTTITAEDLARHNQFVGPVLNHAYALRWNHETNTVDLVKKEDPNEVP